jgi:hypothetical protein
MMGGLAPPRPAPPHLFARSALFARRPAQHSKTRPTTPKQPQKQPKTERKKIEYPILQGLLEGDAILVVNAASTTGACSHRSPSITHAWWGGQAFVYNGAAVEDFRQVKLTDFFKGVAKAEGKTLPSNFYTELAALQGQQLGFTINNLGTAKDCPVLAVTY